MQISRDFSGVLPMLGVCLGHQTIAAAHGATIVRAHEPMHGRTSPIHHSSSPLFKGIPNPTTACRYHSLVVDEESLPDTFQVTARTTDGLIMAIEHRTQPTFGVQFHPEAILTEHGFLLLANFLRAANIPVDDRALSIVDECQCPHDPPVEIPDMMTF